MPNEPRRHFNHPIESPRAVREGVDDEIAFHLAERAAALVREGMTPADARRKAEEEFGDVPSTRDYCAEQDLAGVRSARWNTWLSDLATDLRYAVRMVAKNPGFAAVTILTLGLGIGANTAVFSVVNAVLLRPLPFPGSDRLVAVGQTEAKDREHLGQFSFRNFADLRDRARGFDQLAAYYNTSVTLTGRGEAVRLRGGVATASLFPLLGVKAAQGRVFLPDEDKAGGGPEGYPALLSWSALQQYFGGNSSVLGQPITLDGLSYTVVGILPADFAFPVDGQPAEIWISTARDADKSGQGAIMVARGYRGWRVIGRLKDGETVAQAQSGANVVAAQLSSQFPEANKDLGMRVMPLLESLVGNIRLTLLLFVGTVGVVLLIACSNVAHLLLERGIRRRRETTVRLALGASRGRIARQFITEVMLLAVAGAALGLVIAVFGTKLLVRFNPGGITRINEAHVDARLLGFTVAVAAFTGILFGVFPAFSASGMDLAESLRAGGRGGAGRRSTSARRALVIAEVALSLVLLVGAGLLVRTLARLRQVPLGFQPRNVITMTVAKSPTAEREATSAFFRDLVAQVKALPGVEDASVTWQLPLSGAGASTGLNIEGRPDDPANVPTGILHAAAPGYFRTMGIEIVKGRDFTDHDDMRSAPVLIVNEALARKYFPRGDALGKRIMPGYTTTGEYVQREIVGIVRDVKHGGLASAAAPEFYYAQAQMPVSTMTLVARTTGDPLALVAPIRREVHALDATAPVYAVRTIDEYVSRSTASTRFNTFLVVSFATVALVLTIVGLYGVIAYSVSQATRDIGIRMALGARRLDVLRLVISQGMSLTVGGVVIGLLAALGLTRVMSSLLFGVAATDLLTFAGVAVLLLVVAAVACYVPARRASRVDPMIAIRYD